MTKFKEINFNPFAMWYSNSKKQKHLETIEEMFRPRSYYDEWIGVYNTTALLSYVSQLISIATAFSFPLFFLANSLPDTLGGWRFPLALLFTLCLLPFLEYFSRRTTQKFLKDIVAEGFNNKSMAVAAAALLLLGLSFWSSIEGAKLYVEQADTSIERLKRQQVSKIDSIRSYYDHRILAYRNKMKADSIPANYHQGAFSWELQKVHRKLEEQIAVWEMAKEEKITAYQGTAPAEIMTAEQEIEKRAVQMAFFAGGNIAVFLICMAFMSHFCYRVWVEEGEATTPLRKTVALEPAPHNRPVADNRIERIDQPAEVGQIGFRTGLQRQGNGQNGSRTGVNGYEITCRHCGKTAVMKRDTAKYCSSECRLAHWKESR